MWAYALMSMAFESVVPDEGTSVDTYHDLRLHFRVSLALSLMVLALSLIGATHVLDTVVKPAFMGWLECAITAPVILWAGAPYLFRSFRDAISGRAALFLPAGLAALTAFFYSIAVLALASMAGAVVGRTIVVHFDAAAAIVTFALLAQLLGQRARQAIGSAQPQQEQFGSDRTAVPFVPIVVALALAAWAAWWLLGGSFHSGFLAAVSILAVSSPFALAVAAPLTALRAVGKGARAGVTVCDPAALERFAVADTLVLAKSGTITEGKPRVLAVHATDDAREVEVLAIAASLEAKSDASLAEAFAEAAEERGLQVPEAQNVVEADGLGLKGELGSEDVLLGRSELLAESGISTDALALDAANLRRSGATAMFVARAGRLLGIVATKDPVRGSVRTRVAKLSAQGFDVVLATADSDTTANAVAADAAIEIVASGVSPHGKADFVRSLQDGKHVVAFVGDSTVNAPALAAADVAIALDGRETRSREAGLSIPRGDLGALVRTRRLARAMRRNIKQSLALALAYNALAIPLAGGLLYPFTGLLPSPLIAGAAMSLGTALVIANTRRLARVSL